MRREDIAHQVVADAHVHNNVVGGRIGMAGAHAVEDVLAIAGLIAFHQHAGVRIMRGDVVGAGLDPELQSLGPGVPDEAGRPPVLTVVEVAPLRSIGAGRVLVFVGGVEALIDFDQRLELRVVVPPVGTLIRRGAVRGGDAAQLAQVGIENRTRVQIACVLFPRDG